ncbi:MAG: OmpA family protein, partial [Bacteroidota bacterium]
MKKITLCLLLAVAVSACKIKTTQTTESTDSVTAAADTTFNLDNIPVSDKDLGTFPFLAPPPLYSYNYQQEANPKNIKATDKEYMAVNGKLIAREGKTFKINIDLHRTDEKRFDAAVVQKYYEDKIKELGGIQVNNTEITQAEYDRVGKT